MRKDMLKRLTAPTFWLLFLLPASYVDEAILAVWKRTIISCLLAQEWAHLRHP
jgi:hypothetical protein